jgi:enoyl-CoA hydratase/carnithine racemase
MSAAEAKQYGMIDEVLTSRKLAEVADSRVMELVEPGNFPDGHATDGS